MQAAFIFTAAPFASAHASTLAETAHGLVAAWFAGPHEGHPEVGILPTGQVVGAIDSLPSVADVLADIEAGARAAIDRLC